MLSGRGRAQELPFSILRTRRRRASGHTPATNGAAEVRPGIGPTRDECAASNKAAATDRGVGGHGCIMTARAQGWQRSRVPGHDRQLVDDQYRSYKQARWPASRPAPPANTRRRQIRGGACVVVLDSVASSPQPVPWPLGASIRRPSVFHCCAFHSSLVIIFWIVAAGIRPSARSAGLDGSVAVQLH